MPTDQTSSLTPIHIAHTLVAEVFFSIWGKTELGQDMSRPGPGGLQVMRIKRPVVVPSVSPDRAGKCTMLTHTVRTYLPSHQPAYIPARRAPTWRYSNRRM